MGVGVTAAVLAIDGGQSPWNEDTVSAVWNVHYNSRRPHTAAGDQPPAFRLHIGVTDVMASYG